MSNREPLMVGIADAAKLLGIGRTSLFAAIRNGHVVARKAGRRTLIETAELKKFIVNLPHTDK